MVTLYQELEGSLGGPTTLISFDAGRQSAIIKLATAVCNGLVDDVTLRAAFFPGVNFVQGVSAQGAATKSAIAEALTSKFWGVQNIGTQRDMMNASIVTLMDDLAAGAQDSTVNVVKGVCSAVAGSFQTIVI